LYVFELQAYKNLLANTNKAFATLQQQSKTLLTVIALGQAISDYNH
jgi:hypothetical protein